MAEVSSIHDSFFKSQMSDLRIATDFLQAHIPAWLQEHMDLKQLQPRNSEFIDSEMKKLLTDKLFAVPMDVGSAYIYVLVEHQSTPDPIMPFRVYQYMLRIMEPHMKKDKKSPNIYPFVFYNGKRPYNYSMDFADMFENPSLAGDLLFRNVPLINLSTIPDAELQKHSVSGLFQLCMKHIYDDNIMPFIHQSIKLMKNLEEVGYKDAVCAAVNYCLDAGQVHDRIELIETVTQGLSQSTGDHIMTTADFLREYGREEGIQQGMQQGHQQAQENFAKKLLQRGDSIQEIARLTELDEATLKTLAAQLGSA